MTELMKLYSTDLRASSDTLLDLGTSLFRWKDIYISGTAMGASLTSSTVVSCTTFKCLTATIFTNLTSPVVDSSSVNTAVLKAFTSASAPTINASTMNSSVVKAFNMLSSPIVSCSTSNALVFSGSTIILNNGTNPCINTPILIAQPPVMASGNFWFFSSSNFMYLAVVSNNTPYYVLMTS